MRDSTCKRNRGRRGQSGPDLSGRACESSWNLSWTLKDTEMQKEPQERTHLGAEEERKTTPGRREKGPRAGREGKWLGRFVRASWWRP